MNPLRALFDLITYRTGGLSDPTADLTVTRGRWGARTVAHPDLPRWAQARRRRLVREGLDPGDRAVLDPATVALLRETAVQMAAEERPAGAHTPSPGCVMATQNLAA
jgi:hypothetical protein